MSRPKILFLAHLLPWPLEGGGQIKSYHTLRTLSERYEVTLFTLIRKEEEQKHVQHLEPFCAGGVQCFLIRRSKFTNPINGIKALLKRKSFIINRDYELPLHNEMWIKINLEWYDILHFDHIQMARYFFPGFPPLFATPLVNLPSNDSVKIILDQHNVEHRIIQRIAESSGTNPLMRWYAGIEWRKLRDFEIAAMRHADMTLAVSDADRNTFLSLAPDLASKVEAVPIGVDTDYFTVAERTPSANTILSIGTMSWLPNVDAIGWFADEILPLVRQKKPDVGVYIVGANPAKEVVALGKQDSGVIVTGTVLDVRPYAKECGVFIVPLRSGSGVRVKILNALSMGLPVVSTTIGAEGIAVTHGKNILIADTPQDFADAVCRVLNDREFADRLGTNGRALVEEKYTWEAVGKRLHAVYERVLGAG